MIEQLQAQARLLEKAVQQWFKAHPKVKSARAKDLVDYLVDKKVFLYVGSRPNFTLSRFLDRLANHNLLHLVPSASKIGVTWYFSLGNKVEPPQKETAWHAAMRKFYPKEL